MVELLVVLSILVLLAAMSIPAMRPMLEGRRIREACRAVNVYCGSARGRAKEIGRPCGVVLRRFDGLPQAAMVLEQAEVPPPYAGDTIDAIAFIRRDVTANGGVELTAIFRPRIDGSLVQNGDRMQFNHQGPLYTITEDPGDEGGVGSLTLWIDVSDGQRLPWPDDGSLSQPVPYKIIRRPMKSAATPLQLPAGAVIDLQFSGTDSVSFNPTDSYPIYIMFSPNGAVQRIYSDDGPGAAVTEPIFLLVGKRENVPFDPNDPDAVANWQDLTNLWITLNPQSGLVTTNKVAPSSDPDFSDPDSVAAALWQSREFARQGHTEGGR